MHSSGSIIKTYCEKVRHYLDDPDIDAKYDDNYLVRFFLSSAMTDVIGRVSMMADNQIICMLTISVVNGTTYYKLPPSVKQVLRIGVQDPNTGWFTEDFRPRNEFHLAGPGWALEGNLLAFRPTPSESKNYLVMYVPSGDIAAHHGTLGTINANGTFTLGTPNIGSLDKRDNAYAGSYLRILGSGITDELLITSHDPTTGVVSLRNPPANTAGTYIYEVIPFLMEPMTDAIAISAAMRAGVGRKINQVTMQNLTLAYKQAIKTAHDTIGNMNSRIGKRFTATIEPVGGYTIGTSGSAATTGVCAPCGPAGGDLAGTYPNPTVDGIQGRTVSSAVPSDGQALVWNAAGNNWIPTTIAATGGGTALFVTGHNSTGSNIPKGSIVYINGSHNNSEISVALADADTEPTSSHTIGMTSVDLNHGSSGLIQVFGYLSAIDTNNANYPANEGDPFYLSSTPGVASPTLPVAPKHGVRVGFLVNRAGSGAGSVFINPQNYQELEELSDVFISAPAANHALLWDSADQRWENSEITLSKLGSITALRLVGRNNATSGSPEEISLGAGLKMTGTVLSSNTSDVVSTATTISAGTGLTGGGDLTANRTISANFGTAASTICQGNDSRLSDARTPTAHTHPVSDLTAGTASTNDVLTFNGTAWVPAAPTGGTGNVGTDVIWDAKGDLALGVSSNTAQRLAAGANGTVLVADSGQTVGARWHAIEVPTGSFTTGTNNTTTPGLYQTVRYTATTTSITVPAGATFMLVVGAGGGGGGGGGQMQVTTDAARAGGGGGQGGQGWLNVFRLSDIGSPSTIQVTIGAGGTAGVGAATGATTVNGTAGGAGGASLLETSGGTLLARFPGGEGGAGGASTNAAGGSTAQFIGLAAGFGGRGGRTTNIGYAGGNHYYGGGGGGGGGGHTTTNADTNCGDGGASGYWDGRTPTEAASATNSQGTARPTAVATAGNPGSAGSGLFGGNGGSGGTGHRVTTTGSAGAGGAGGAGGGGGGGGGARVNYTTVDGSKAGDGGVGGAGFVTLRFW